MERKSGYIILTAAARKYGVSQVRIWQLIRTKETAEQHGRYAVRNGGRSTTRRVYAETLQAVGGMATAYKARKEQRIINN